MNWTRDQKLVVAGIVATVLLTLLTLSCGGCGAVIKFCVDTFQANQASENGRSGKEAEADAQRAAQQAQFDHERDMANAAEAAKAPRPVRRFRRIADGTAYITIQNVGQQQLSFGYAGIFETPPKMGDLPQANPGTVPQFPMDLSAWPINEARSLDSKPVIGPGEILELVIKLPKKATYPIEVRLYWTEEECIGVDFSHP